MARYRRYRRTIIRAPKKKWASNIVSASIVTSGTTSLQYGYKDIVTNSTEAASPTPVIVKTGNIKVQGDCRVNTSVAGSGVSISLFVVFVPQGISLETALEADSLVKNHPEWIMTWKFIGYDMTSSTSQENLERYSFSSRLKRNLNSGDSVKLICLASGSNITSVLTNGMAQFWTCAN